MVSRRTPAADADPFDTSGLRATVLAAWAASPARFREDANAEEALAIGGYSGRLLIELAANAVDAAREAGVPGRVRFELLTSEHGPELRAANTGAPLTAAGVAALASLRASAKRDRTATVGHFGVGFTAVLTVTDSPVVLSTTGGVRFDRSGTAVAVRDLSVDELDEEVTARAGQVPALRLPWPVTSADPVPAGFTTEVRLPLGPGRAPEIAALLRDVDDEMVWALPGLGLLEVQIPDAPLRTISRAESGDGRTVISRDADSLTYRTVSRQGSIPAGLLADRPIEERARDHWQLTWITPEAEPVSTSFDEFLRPSSGPSYLGAPTPTDEPLSLPARLVGTFPVDDTRRRLASGALNDHLLAQAASAYVDLVLTAAPEHRLALVPAAGFPLGPVDATLRAAVLTDLTRSPILLTALGEPIAPVSACVVTGIGDDAAVLLAEAVPGLLLPPRSPAQTDALRVLGVRVLPLAEATTALAGIEGDPPFWREVYQSLADQSHEDLANLPVPLSGGGRRVGPAGCLLPGPDALDEELLIRAAELAPELRLVHPEAAHPLLARLGAVPADAAALLADPGLAAVFRNFREELEDSDPDPDELRLLAKLALDLAGATGPGEPRPGLPGPGLLGDVVLTSSDGEAWPAGELLAPSAPLARVLAPDADLPMIGAEWAVYPLAALAAVGVRTGLRVVTVVDPTGPDADLPDLDLWWSEVIGDAMPPDTFTALGDLDLIDDQSWPQVLQMVAADPAAAATFSSGPVPSYTRWWFSRFALLGGDPPSAWRLPGSHELTGLYEEMPVAVDRDVARSIGVLVTAQDAVDADPADFLHRLTDPSRRVAADRVPALTALAVRALEADGDLNLPGQVRTLAGVVIDADEALVLDLPYLAQAIAADVLVPGGADPVVTGRVLDLDLASTTVAVQILSSDTDPGPLTGAHRRAAERAAAALGRSPDDLPAMTAISLSAGLSVSIDGGPTRRVHWWGGQAGLVVDGSADGTGRAVAWLTGRWADRHLAIAAAAGDLGRLAEYGLD